MNTSTRFRKDGIELLAAPTIRAALTAETAAWLQRLHIEKSIDSTNTTLLQWAATMPIDGCVLTAEAQTAGRGRRGREWLSPFGRNLAVSIGFRSEQSPTQLGALSLVVGLAVRQAVLDIGVEGVELKWPNDVLLDGRKLGGILIELVRATKPVEVVIGIGVNVGGGETIAEHVDQSIADVAEQIARPVRNELLAQLLNRVVAACQRFEQAGFGPFREAWQNAHRYQGATVVVTKPGNASGTTGTVLGVADDGALRLRTQTGIEEFNSGEVTLRAEREGEQS